MDADAKITSNTKTVARILSKNFIYVIIGALIVILSFANPRFLSADNFYNILNASAPYFIVTIGMAFALITKGIDMSVGSVALFAVAVAAKASTVGVSTSGMVAIILVMGVALGFVNGLINAWLKVYPLLTTLATMLAYKGLALYVIENKLVLMPEAWNYLIKGRIGIFPYTFLLAVGLALVAQFFLSNTKYGRYVYAIGDNVKNAKEKGINVPLVKIIVYTISGFMASFAGIIWSTQTMSITFSFANGIEFNVVIAAVLGGISVLGGKGSAFPGAMIGAVIVAIINNAMILLDIDILMVAVVNALFVMAVVVLDTVNNRKL